MSFGHVVEEMARAYLLEQVKSQNIKNWNGANLAYLDKANLANKLKLTPQQVQGIMPYPGSTYIVSEQPQPSLLGRIAPYVLAAALGSMGPIVGSYLLSSPPQEQVNVSEPEPEPGPGQGSVGFTVE